MAGLNDTEMGYKIHAEGIISWDDATQIYHSVSKGRMFDMLLLSIKKNYRYKTYAEAVQHIKRWNDGIRKARAG